MAICAACMTRLDGDAQLCLHHHAVFGDNWAEANRVWCNYFHRGEPIPRLSVAERDEEVVA